MNFLIELIIGLLKAFLPAVVKESKDTYRDAHKQKEVTMKLKEKILKKWGRGSLILLACFCLSGCFTKTVYVPDQTPIRLREDVKNVKVWVIDELGMIREGTLDLKEGWFVLSLPNQPPVAEKKSGQLVGGKLK